MTFQQTRFRRRFSAFFLCLALPLLLVFTAPSTASAHPQPAGTLRGRVIDALSKDPLPGARIAIVGTGKGAVSGLDGSFRLRLDPGTYSLRITYSGYRDTTYVINMSDADQSLDFGLARNTTPGKEITVVGAAEHGSDASSMASVKSASNVINSVSARTIEVSPDISVADVTKRMSGVSVSRTSTGDAHYAIIRGMDKRYNYTTINGVKIPSPDNKNRYVPLDIFPSELVDRVEVSKTLLPSMEGDAIGGAMNLVMKQAPDHAITSLQVGTGYSDLFSGDRKFSTFDANPTTQSPRASIAAMTANMPPQQAALAEAAAFPSGAWSPRPVIFVPGAYLSATVGNRFLEDQSLGIIAAGSYQNSYRGANTTFWKTDVSLPPSLSKNAAGQSIPTDYVTNLASFQNRSYSSLLSRGGGMLNADYRADENNTLQLFGMYASLSKHELRDQWDTLHGKGSWPVNNEVTHEIRATVEDQGIANITLSGAHTLFGDDLKLDWKLVYSRATLDIPDQATLQLGQNVNFDTNGVVHAGSQLVQAGDGTNTRKWTNSTDQDKSIYLNLKSLEPVFGLPIEFSYGGMLRLKLRSASYDEFDLDPVNAKQLYSGNVTLDTFTLRNATSGTQLPILALNYQAGDTTYAWYAQGKFAVGDLSVVGGLRGEVTHFGWSNPLPLTDSGNTGFGAWTDNGLPFFLLPSVSFKYSLGSDQNWRLSYFRSTSYPNFYEYVYNLGVQGDDYKEVPNSYVRATTAHNLDLRWEYFPGGLDQLLAGVFYKQLQNPIEYVVKTLGTDWVYTPDNLGTATNYGFELDFRKYFSNFGIQGNYTYTNSKITTPKIYRWEDTTAVKPLHNDTISQTRPLQGQSEHIGNLALLYKNFESGTDAQVSGVYTGPAIVGVSDNFNNDVWQTGFLQLDFSGEQRLVGNLTLYFKATNLLNAAREEVIHQTYLTSQYPQAVNGQTNGQDVLVRHELYNRNFILGFRYKM